MVIKKYVLFLRKFHIQTCMSAEKGELQRIPNVTIASKRYTLEVIGNAYERDPIASRSRATCTRSHVILAKIVENYLKRARKQRKNC